MTRCDFFGVYDEVYFHQLSKFIRSICQDMATISQVV
jgi:hypothetical protein